MAIAFYDAAQVEELLDYPGCIEAMRQAMIALSTGERLQPLRQIFTVGKDQMFGTMPGELAALSTFGAKLVSVFGDPDRPGRSRHQGVVVAYDGQTGAVSCIADAEPVTKIRTACATAVATDALARADAEVLAVFGTGVQAEAHLRALPLVRPFREILIWGRVGAKDARIRRADERVAGPNDHCHIGRAGSRCSSRRDLHGDIIGRARPVERMGQAGNAHQPRRLELSGPGRGELGPCREGALYRRLSSRRACPGRRTGGRPRGRIDRRYACDR